MSHHNIPQKTPLVTVKPPDTEEIEEFAHKVIHTMKNQHGRRFDADTVQGLIEFMTIACRVTAKIRQKEINNGKKDPQ